MTTLTAPHDPLIARAAPLRGLRVLVVEDREELRELFAALLRDDGATVASAASGRDAIALAATHRLDAVLCDLGLPDMSGELVISHLVGASTAPPTVAVISGADEIALGRAHAAGARTIFRKPVDWQHIIVFLREVNRARLGARAAAA